MGGRFQDATLSLLGGIAGSVVGVAIFKLLIDQRLYGLVLPGAFLGLGVYALSRTRSTTRGVVAGVLALLLGIVVEWKFFPWVNTPGFVDFLRKIPDLQPITLVMIALGSGFAFWWGRDARLIPRSRPGPGASRGESQP